MDSGPVRDRSSPETSPYPQGRSSGGGLVNANGAADLGGRAQGGSKIGNTVNILNKKKICCVLKKF
jgi:hypothetical protein